MDSQINSKCEAQICSITETTKYCDNFTANNSCIEIEKSINEYKS